MSIECGLSAISSWKWKRDGGGKREIQRLVPYPLIFLGPSPVHLLSPCRQSRSRGKDRERNGKKLGGRVEDRERDKRGERGKGEERERLTSIMEKRSREWKVGERI